MKVCIAEKPSVGRELAAVLGAKTRKEGYFEGNGYQVTWTFGHLCTLKSPDEYTPDWKRWNIDHLPMIPDTFETKLIRQKGISKQFNIIQSLVKSCDEVINCGDAGIEGELIQRWVLEKAGCDKPVRRLWISSLTEEAIREGFLALKDASEYDLLYAAGSARAIGDWLLGMNASRLYTLKYAHGRGVLSIGRVQTPTLALMVKRHLEIINFIPEPYSVLKTVFKDVTFTAQKKKFATKQEAQQVLNAITGKNFSITGFENKKGKEAPPLLFDLTSLQVEANKKFGFSADRTLKAAQKLYEMKVITYPRVDTNYLPSDLYPRVTGILQKLKDYSEYTGQILKETVPKKSRIFNDKKITDHHAIIPTGVVRQGLARHEQDIYDQVCRRFIAAFYPDCLILNTTVTGEVEKIIFKATGKQVLEVGWRKIYTKEEQAKKKSTKNREPQIIPVFEKGESGPHKPFIEEKETTPPKYYTEASLLRAMETAGKQVDDEQLRELMKENGIGRPSTRANIIETLFKRNYITKMKKSLVPTETGIQLIQTIENELLKSVELTGLWEKKLRQIEKKEYTHQKFIDEMKEMVAQLVRDVKNSSNKKIEIQKTKRKYKKARTKPSQKKTSAGGIADLTCPKCQEGKIIRGKTAYGCDRFKNGCDFRVPFECYGKKLSEKQVMDLISKGATKELSGFISQGEKTKASLCLSQDFVPVLKKHERKNRTQHEQLDCPRCNKGTIIKGKTAYGCNRYKEGCHFIIRFDELSTTFNSTILTRSILDTFRTDS